MSFFQRDFPAAGPPLAALGEAEAASTRPVSATAPADARFFDPLLPFPLLVVFVDAEATEDVGDACPDPLAPCHRAYEGVGELCALSDLASLLTERSDAGEP